MKKGCIAKAAPSVFLWFVRRSVVLPVPFTYNHYFETLFWRRMRCWGFCIFFTKPACILLGLTVHTMQLTWNSNRKSVSLANKVLLLLITCKVSYWTGWAKDHTAKFVRRDLSKTLTKKTSAATFFTISVRSYINIWYESSSTGILFMYTDAMQWDFKACELYHV